MSARRQARWLLAGCVLGTAGGCGQGEAPAPAPLTKKVPQLAHVYQGRTLPEWREHVESALVPERIAAAYAMAQLEREPAQSVDALLRLMADEDAGVRLAALEAVGRLAPTGEGLAERVVDAFEDEHEALRARARFAAERLGAAGLPALGRALKDPRAIVRWNALVVLDGLQEAGAPLREAVVQVLEDPQAHVNVHRQAVFTVARLGPQGVARVLEYSRQSEEQAALGVDALARIGPDALRQLATGLAGPDDVAATVLRVLARRGTEAAFALEPLLALVREGSPLAREAVDVLIAIGPPSLPGLRLLAEHELGSVRAAARRALEALGDS